MYKLCKAIFANDIEECKTILKKNLLFCDSTEAIIDANAMYAKAIAVLLKQLEYERCLSLSAFNSYFLDNKFDGYFAKCVLLLNTAKLFNLKLISKHSHHAWNLWAMALNELAENKCLTRENYHLLLQATHSVYTLSLCFSLLEKCQDYIYLHDFKQDLLATKQPYYITHVFIRLYDKNYISSQSLNLLFKNDEKSHCIFNAMQFLEQEAYDMTKAGSEILLSFPEQAFDLAHIRILLGYDLSHWNGVLDNAKHAHEIAQIFVKLKDNHLLIPDNIKTVLEYPELAEKVAQKLPHFFKQQDFENGYKHSDLQQDEMKLSCK